MAESTVDRARRYISNLEKALERLEGSLGETSVCGANVARLLDAVKRYLEDASYYLNRGDAETALVAASYAEGLLDSLNYLGIASVEWPRGFKREEPVVFIGGTFDIIHPGHIELMEYASRLGRLHVVVARDVNVEKIKGRKPVLGERDRLRIVSSIRYVYRAMLGDKDDLFRSVERVKPDIIVLGPDQGFDERHVEKIARERTGKEVKVLRYPQKSPFSGGMRGSKDIVNAICRACNRVSSDPGR